MKIAPVTFIHRDQHVYTVLRSSEFMRRVSEHFKEADMYVVYFSTFGLRGRMKVGSESFLILNFMHAEYA